MNNIKKILCITQGYEMYGSDRSFIRSINILKNHFSNADIDVIIPQKGPLAENLINITKNIIIDNNLGVLRRAYIKKFKLKNLLLIPFRLPKIIKTINEYDIIYINSIVVLDFIIASRFSRKTSIIHIREITSGITNKIFSLILKFSKANIIFNSYATSNNYSLNKKQHSFVVYNGIEEIKNNIKYNYQNKNTINIMQIGRISKQKGQLLLIEAINNLNNTQKKGIKVNIIGNTFENQKNYLDLIKSKISQYNLNDIITILPFSKNTIDNYNWADIVIIPSTKPESFGLVAIEAMNAAKPVIAANHGGITEIVKHNITGILFKPNSISDLTNAIQKLINNPQLIQLYGTNGKNEFSNKFTISHFQKNFINTINNIIILSTNNKK